MIFHIFIEIAPLLPTLIFLSFPSFNVALWVNGWSQKIFSKKQMATLRRDGEMGYFWAEGVIFASQFGQSGFHISLSQQVLSAFFGNMLLHSLINKLVMTIKTTMVKRQRFQSIQSKN